MTNVRVFRILLATTAYGDGVYRAQQMLQLRQIIVKAPLMAVARSVALCGSDDWLFRCRFSRTRDCSAP